MDRDPEKQVDGSAAIPAPATPPAPGPNETPQSVDATADTSPHPPAAPTPSPSSSLLRPKWGHRHPRLYKALKFVLLLGVLQIVSWIGSRCVDFASEFVENGQAKLAVVQIDARASAASNRPGQLLDLYTLALDGQQPDWKKVTLVFRSGRISDAGAAWSSIFHIRRAPPPSEGGFRLFDGPLGERYFLSSTGASALRMHPSPTSNFSLGCLALRSPGKRDPHDTDIDGHRCPPDAAPVPSVASRVFPMTPQPDVQTPAPALHSDLLASIPLDGDPAAPKPAIQGDAPSPAAPTSAPVLNTQNAFIVPGAKAAPRLFQPPPGLQLQHWTRTYHGPEPLVYVVALADVVWSLIISGTVVGRILLVAELALGLAIVSPVVIASGSRLTDRGLFLVVPWIVLPIAAFAVVVLASLSSYLVYAILVATDSGAGTIATLGSGGGGPPSAAHGYLHGVFASLSTVGVLCKSTFEEMIGLFAHKPAERLVENTVRRLE